MEFFVYINLLLVALVSASPLTDNESSRYEDGVASFSSVTTSPFLKIIRTSDVTVSDAIYSSPAVAFIGTSDKLLRCLYEDPNQCEVFYNTGTNVYSLVIAGEYIYAALDSGVILRCNLYQGESCKNFQTSEPNVISLAAANGYLYAGDNDGTTLRCQLHEPNSCRPFHVMGSSVYSLIHFNDHIYAGLEDGKLMRFSTKIENNGIQLFDMNSSIYGISTVGNSIVAVTSNSSLWKCSQKLDATSDYCELLPLNYDDDEIKNIASFNDVLYLLNAQGIYCKWKNNTHCSNYGNIKNVWSMTFVYGVYHMQSRYKNEDATCIWQSSSMCPPTVIYYDFRQRHLLQVNVKDGRLYNALGVLVDTSNADEGRSEGPTAVFAMGPDGTILVSNRHIKELIHTSSLFAGSPVSGAGEMVVKNGVIETISTCSDHYRPNLNLNRQVIQSLRAQGYTDPIQLQLCGENNELGQIESSTSQ